MRKRLAQHAHPPSGLFSFGVSFKITSCTEHKTREKNSKQTKNHKY